MSFDINIGSNNGNSSSSGLGGGLGGLGGLGSLGGLGGQEGLGSLGGLSGLQSQCAGGENGGQNPFQDAFKQAFTDIATKVFSQALQNYGITGQANEDLTKAFHDGLAQSMGLSPERGAQLQPLSDHIASEADSDGSVSRGSSQLQDSMSNWLVNQGIHQRKPEADTSGGDNSQSASSTGGAGGMGGSSGISNVPGWLEAVVNAMGKLADQTAGDLQNLTKNISKDDPSTSMKAQEMSQFFNMILTASTNLIDTIGKAESSTVQHA